MHFVLIESPGFRWRQPWSPLTFLVRIVEHMTVHERHDAESPLVLFADQWAKVAVKLVGVVADEQVGWL